MKYLILVAALFGFVSPATASPIKIDLTLQLTAQDWYFFEVYDHDGDELEDYASPDPSEPLNDLMPPLGSRNLGDIVLLRAIIDPDVETSVAFGQAQNCLLGNFSCKTGSYGSAQFSGNDTFYIGNDGSTPFEITGAVSVGEAITFDWDPGDDFGFCEYETGGVVQWYTTGCGHQSSFTVVSSSLTSVPLPPSMSLFAVALIGAGGWARRRKRIATA